MLIATATRPTMIEPDPCQNEEMARLDAATALSSSHDVSPFVRAYRTMNWENRCAEEYVHAVRQALWVGAHSVGRDLALKGAGLFPDHAELQKMAYILGPPKVIATKPSGPRPNIAADHQWIKENREKYWGHWVAIKDGELLAIGDSFDAVVKQVGEIRNTGILVTSLW